MISDGAELAQLVAHHFAGARTEGNVVETELAGLRIACGVAEVETNGVSSTATLHFLLTAGGFQSHVVRAHYVGFGRSPEEAVAAGVASWCHGHAIALKAAAGATGVVPFYDIESRSYLFRVHAGSSQRAFGEQGTVDLEERLRAANERHGAQGALTRAAIASGRLELSRDRWSAVSVTLVEHEGSRNVEVRLDGGLIPNMDSVFAEPDFEQAGAKVVLHELGIVVPNGPAPRDPTVIVRRLN